MNEFSKYKVFLRIMIFPLIFLFSGCAGNPNPETFAKREVANEQEISSSQLQIQENEKLTSKRPKIKLSKDILFKIMVAEIAGHRGEIELTTKYYLDLAKITLDPVIIERATRIAVYARNDEASYEAAKIGRASCRERV